MRAVPARQHGVAVITALLLTTLAVTLVASLFWMQQVQIRSLENQRVQMQTQAVVRATLDWARRILREDAAKSAVDSLDEPWAIPLPETKLDSFVDGAHSAGDQGSGGSPTMSAYLTDAQSRFNLANLAQGRVPDPKQLAIFRRLLTLLGQNPGLANAALDALVATQTPAPPTPTPAPGGGDDSGAGAPNQAPAPAPMPLNAKVPLQVRLARLDDLMTAPGFTPKVIERLRPHVVVLPVPTLVNVNTADAEVLAASLNRSAADMTSLIAERGHAYFKDTADFANRAKCTPDDAVHTVRSDFFLLQGKVRIERGGLDMQALIYRKSTGNTTVKWVRQY